MCAFFRSPKTLIFLADASRQRDFRAFYRHVGAHDHSDHAPLRTGKTFERGSSAILLLLQDVHVTACAHPTDQYSLDDAR